MGSKGSNTTTTQQQQSYQPAGAGYITGALNQAQNAAQLPFNLPQAPVAGFSQDQQSAFQNVNNAQGMGLPYFNTAASYFSPEGTNAFLNPYASNVMGNLQDIFGQQTSQNDAGLTQAAGGVGADRIAVGHAALAKQQGLVAGQTMSDLYKNAGQMAQSAGYGIGALGSAAQNSVLQGAQAQLGTGGLQQQLSQAQLNSPYQLALAQAAFPYQQSGFLSGAVGSLAPGLGGTTTGQGSTTGPAPSMLSQILGLGTAAAGAAGGSGAFSGGGKGASYGGGSMFGGDAYGGSSSNPLAGLSASDYGAGYAEGGEVSSPFDLPPNFNDKPINVAEHSIIPTVQTPAIRPEVPKLNLNPPAQSSGGSGGLGDIAKTVMSIAPFFLAQGGRVNPYARGGVAGFGPGGEVTDEERALGYQMLREGMGTRAPDSIPGGEPLPEPYRMPDAGAYRNWQQGADASMADGTSATPVAFKPAFPPPSGSHGRSMGAPAIEQPADAPQDVSARSRTPVAPQEDTSEGTQAGKSGRFIDSPWAALMAAGLGIAGGTSPFAAVNIGQGGLQGLKTLQEQRASGQKDETIAQATRRLDLEAKHHEDQYTRMTPYQKGELGVKKEEMAYKKQLLGDGTMSADAVDLAVDRIHAGDPRALVNLGRGAQSGVNLTRIQNRLAERAAAEGWTGADLAASQANFTSQAAGARTAAVRSAGIDQAVEEARNTFPLALKASEAVPRGQFVPWNKAVQAVRAGTSSPELARFVAANQAVITAYGQAMSRTGINTVHAQEAAERLLSTATSPESYKAVISQLELEMQAAKSAPETVRQQILNRIAHPGGQGPAATTTPAAAASPAVPDALGEARNAIAKGVPRDVVIKRLQEHGINPTGL